METNNTKPPSPPPPQPAPQMVQLAIVNLGSVIFHNKWFHSAGVAPAKDPEGNLIEGAIQLKISLVSPGGVGEGFTFTGTENEIKQLYAHLQQQVGTLPASAFQQAPPKEPPAEYAPLELARPDKGDKDASEQNGPSDEA